MKFSRKSKLLNSVVSAAGLVGFMVTANAAIVGDTPEIAKLRSQFVEGVTSNDPEAVAQLVSDDYVMLQPNLNGPDTYGKKAYINYRKSMNSVVGMTITPERVLLCGSEWAVEASIEEMEWDRWYWNGKTTAHVMKLLNRQESGEWKYARTFRAWNVFNSYTVKPPAPEFIANTGFGSWEPRKQDAATAKIAQEMIDFQFAGTKALVSEATDDSVSFMSDVIFKPNESTGDLIAYGEYGGLYGVDQYMQMRYEISGDQVDEVRKIFEEAIMCEENMGFVWGQGVSTGAYEDGERWMGTSDSLYFMIKQDGQWRIGPVGLIYEE